MIEVILFAITVIATALLAWKYQEKILFLLIAAAPIYLIKTNLGPLPSNLLEAGIIGYAASFALMFATVKSEREKIIRAASTQKKPLIAIWILVVIGLISVVVSQDFIAAIGIWRAYFVEAAIIASIFAISFNYKKHEKAFFTSISIGIIVVSLLAILQFFTEIGIPTGYLNPKRATSIFPYPAALAWYIVPWLTIVWYRMLFVRKAVIEIGAIVLGGAALVLSLAEGGIGAFAISAYVGLIIKKKTRMGALVMGMSIAGLIIGVPELREYAVTVLTFSDVSGEVRLAIWEGTINLLRENPITGSGLASFPEIYAQYKLDRHVELILYPHNIFLNFWVETGILGLVYSIALVGAVLQKTFKKPFVKNNVFFACMAFATILIYGLVDVPFFKNDLSIHFLVMIALILTNKKSDTETANIGQGSIVKEKSQNS